MVDIRAIARERGIKPGKMTKAEMIHAIQRQEGNIVCYRTRTECDQLDCCWRNSCLPRQTSGPKGGGKYKQTKGD